MATRYWAVLAKERGSPEGPYSVDELLQRGMEEITPVCPEGTTEWVRAQQRPELQQAFGRYQFFKSVRLGLVLIGILLIPAFLVMTYQAWKLARQLGLP